jgi:hypothetical protein
MTCDQQRMARWSVNPSTSTTVPSMDTTATSTSPSAVNMVWAPGVHSWRRCLVTWLRLSPSARSGEVVIGVVDADGAEVTSIHQVAVMVIAPIGTELAGRMVPATVAAITDPLAICHRLRVR